MIVEQVEAFKTWLTAVLKPMCEADPAALAKYVLALIKKDKSEDELRKSMVAQLDVFLEAETESFVDLVFQTLTTKEYMNVPIVPNTNPPNPNMGKVKEPAKESKVIIQPSELPNLNEAVNGNAKKEQEVKRDRENRLENRKNSDAEKEKEKDKEKDKEREDRPVRVLRRSPVTIRHRSLSRNRSRSRSWDRTKRSRSREKSRDRDQHRVDRDKRDRPRIWRNKSPPRSRYDRRRGAASRTPSPPLLGRARTRSRSPRHAHRSRYRTRTSTSRSRSRSPDAKRDRRDSAKDKDAAGSRPGSPAQDSNHGDMDARLSNTAHNLQGGAGKKKRCRDFDEKGYCMSGDMCPFDHGVDPVVLEDAALSRVLTYNPNGGPAGGPRAPLHSVVPDNPYNPQAPQLWRDFRPGGPGGRVPPMGIARVPPLGPYPPATNMNRELIPVPVMDNGGPKPPDGYPPMVGPPYHPPGVPPFPPHHDGYKKRGPFDFNRLGPVRHQQKNPQNCSLELKKVPNGMNTITHLNNHFGKFGKIVNIQVQYEGDPEAALITFSSHAEANAAYRSTEAVLNNRFIKVFWHNSNPQQPADAKHQENVPPSMRSVKDRLGTQASQAVPPNANKVFNLVQPKADDTSAPGVPGEEKPQDASSGDEKTKEENHTQAVEAIKKGQELLAAQAKVRKNQDVQRKQVIQIQCDLRKKKQELLDKQLSQQKILVEKMEKMPPGPARDLIKDTIKKTQEAIAAITKDLEAAALAASKASAAKPKTKEEAQRELLDAELDLIAKQQEGADTKELQKKLNELRAKVAAAGAVTRGGRIGRRYPLSTPVIGRHLLTKNNLKLKAMKTVNRPSTTSQTSTALNTTFQKHTVDHRPTKLLVSGYETDEQDSVLSHFQQYGEIADYEVDASIPSITLNYKSRKEAEMALLKGKHFQDRTLSITWSTSKQLNRQRSSGSTSTRTVVMSETEEDQLIDSNILDGAEEDLGPEISEEALLQDDEEEEDEDRSWRR